MIDFSLIDVEDLVIKLDLQNPRLSSSGLELNFSCFGPEHTHGDESPSAYINVETSAWFCHGCKRRGNAVGLVMEVQQVTRPIAERFLRDTYGIEFAEPVGGSMVAETEARFRLIPPEPDPPKPPQSWLSGARVDWSGPREPFMDYMLNRGLSPDVLTAWEVGYDYLSDRISIPIFDIDGTLVGIKARGWREDQVPKYLILGDKPDWSKYGFWPFESSNYVFGLNRNRECRTVVLCEGELNAIALSQLGVPRPIATGMSYFSDRHAELITREADEAVVYYDFGNAGYEGMWGRRNAAGKQTLGAVQMLEPYMRVRVADPLPDDPADLLRLGRGQEALDLIDAASSSLAKSLIFR